MKKTYKLYLLTLACFFSVLGMRLNATTVDLSYTYSYLNSPCTVPATGTFTTWASTTGYTIADSVVFFLDFGDGNDTTVTEVQNFQANTGYSALQGITHLYNTAGIYTITFIATLPDGNADTVVTALMVNNTCNNVTGRIYVDVNSDCVYNAGDIPMSNYNVGLNYNNMNVSSAYTNAQGQYSLSALPGYSYNLIAGSQYDPTLSFSCSTSQGMVITPSPNASQDIISDNSTTVHIAYAGDSAAMWNGNCVPYTSGSQMYGTTLNYSAPNDSLHMYINFGDGQDTTYTTPLTGPVGYFNFYVSHTYTAYGNYNVLYIATATDGRSDTIINYNEVVLTDTCGNVEGTLYNDTNANCIMDAGEMPMSWVGLVLSNSTSTYYTYTDANGHYSFSVPPATYTLAISNNYLSYLSFVPTCPSSASVTATVTANNTITQDFGLDCPSGFDYTGMISIQHGIFPTSNSYIRPYINNLSCTQVPGSITFILDPMVIYVGVCDTAFQPTVVGNTLTWTFNTNSSYFLWYYWYMQSGCIEVTGDPGLQMGDSVCFTMIINPMTGDANPANNTIVRCVPALVALDPNVKSVLPEGSGPLGLVPQATAFDYTIEFQNTGTAAARDIFVLDSLDADLDLSTLVITGSSHQMATQLLTGNVLKFTFDDIWLADSTSDEPNSHGWITYHIAAKSMLPNMTPIQNTAGIYFDFNAPVITNSTLNTIYDPSGVGEITAGNGISIFPVPADQYVQISTTGKAVSEIVLTDISGRVIRSEQLTGTTGKLFTGDLADGVYLISVRSEGNVVTEKIVVSH
jgi:hypothetical protein